MPRNDVHIERRTIDGTIVEVRRSTRRRRSVHAFRDGELIVLQVPAALSAPEVDAWAVRMIARVAAKETKHRTRTPRSDDALAARAVALSAQYLDGTATPASIRWVHNQNSRWGSCTPASRTIRLSHRLQTMPDWVVDYVILHELTHLLEASHGRRFWALVDRYPRAERAQGFLEGVANAAGIADAWPRRDGPADGDTP
ncbi:MAG: M48 family metallopeptidase [Cumulibacter sp.]